MKVNQWLIRSETVVKPWCTRSETMVNPTKSPTWYIENHLIQHPKLDRIINFLQFCHNFIGV